MSSGVDVVWVTPRCKVSGAHKNVHLSIQVSLVSHISYMVRTWYNTLY